MSTRNQHGGGTMPYKDVCGIAV